MTEQAQPDQTLPYPGPEEQMQAKPADEMADYQGRDLLSGQVAVITGGDSGIGRAVAVAFAKEGADIVFAYLEEHEDAERTQELVKAAGRSAIAIPGDVADPTHRSSIIATAVEEFGGINILVNNAAFQAPVSKPEDLDLMQWRRTFEVNVESMFFLIQAALPYLGEGSAIINTASVTGLRGNPELLDYSASKGAILAMTLALAKSLLDRGIRVNAVAPGPVWTPLIPATFEPDKVAEFGRNTPMGRAAQPDEIAPSYVFLASNRLSGFYSGTVLSPVGGPSLNI